MGKVIEKISLTNVYEPGKTIEISATVDTGATMLVLPTEVVEQLALRKIREVDVKYANNLRQRKSIYGVVMLNLRGRIGNFDVLAEERGTGPLIGQIVLEELDLVVDAKGRQLIPNPESPDIPLIEVL